MALKLPPLSGLRLFEATARCGSFERAAQELNLTPGALSHGIDSLEQWLDVELFELTRGHVREPWIAAAGSHGAARHDGANRFGGFDVTDAATKVALVVQADERAAVSRENFGRPGRTGSMSRRHAHM